MIQFKVLPPTRTLKKTPAPTFILVQDNWNDYSYLTSYELHYVTPESDTFIGVAKILRLDQTRKHGLLITEDFTALGSEFVSIGNSLDYYEHLALFDESTRNQILDALQDAVRNRDKISLFSEHEGWHLSLFRDQSASEIEEFFNVGQAMLEGNYTSIPDENFRFFFKINEWDEGVEFDFQSSTNKNRWARHYESIPSRVVSIIGRNGSGKSTLLARLARVAHGSTSARRLYPLAGLGSLEPPGIGFPRIITVSYSAFDSFELPGVNFKEKQQIVKDVRSGEGRFVFCGLRDIATELEHSEENSISDKLGGESDRTNITFLKPIAVLADEFARTLSTISQKGRSTLFDSALKIVANDPSWDAPLNSSLSDIISSNPKEHFLSWSTGHKIVMQILVNLTAYTTPRSLVLMDEPETHLHPPMLASLMHAVQHILEDQRAFAVVATHSPVVLQETLTTHVRVVRRSGLSTTVTSPKIQTFGENIGTLTSEMFGMNSQSYDFYSILDSLITLNSDIEKIEAKFAPHGLSNQARAYLMSKLAQKMG